MSSLYLCYQSLLEPLTQTQVVAYLEGLAGAGYGIHLLTFEPRALSDDESRAWRERMARKGIAWHWRRYHKRPTLPATAFDVLVGIFTGWTLIRKHRIGLVHARSHVPGVMGLWLKRLTGVKLLFDVRGLMAEEYVDGGAWTEGGGLFRLTKRVERSLLQGADGIVVLTHEVKRLFDQWYSDELAGKALEVIPCCVDTGSMRRRERELAPTGSSEIVNLVYAGKLGGWYPTREMVDFVVAAREFIPNLTWRVLTQSDSRELREISAEQGLVGAMSIDRVAPEALPVEFAKARLGLCLYRRKHSAAACSPTKVAEYLAAGLPVVATAGIGDTDAVLTGGGRESETSCSAVGVLVTEPTEKAYMEAAMAMKRLLDDPDTPRRCRAVAEEHFDLQRVGWVRYRRIYEELIGRPDGPHASREGDRADRLIEPRVET